MTFTITKTIVKSILCTWMINFIDLLKLAGVSLTDYCDYRDLEIDCLVRVTLNVSSRVYEM